MSSTEDAITVSSSGTLVQHPLGLWDQTKKPVLLGAVALAVGLMASRGRARSGVFGTLVKGALYGALSAIPQIILLRLSNRFLGHKEPPESTVPSAAVVTSLR